MRSGEQRILLRREDPLQGGAPHPDGPLSRLPHRRPAAGDGRPVQGAGGTTVFVENMFESRYRHVDELCRMGARIRVEGRVAVVCGVERLHGAPLRAADLRGGAALVVAALGAEGVSHIEGLSHIDRGYHGLEETLRGMGAQIRRLEDGGGGLPNL